MITTGIFSFVKRKRQELYYAKMLNGSLPIFSSFGENIYASDVVRQAVNKIVTELMKLQIAHTRDFKKDDASTPQDSSIQGVLDRPNEIMTTSDMLSKIGWSIFLYYNAWVYPTRDSEGRLTGLYPITPSQVTFKQDATGRLYVILDFFSGYQSPPIPYDDIIHYRYQYSVNDLMGGDMTGNPDQRALLETLKLNHTMMQSISKGIKASYAVNGIIKSKTIINKELNEPLIKQFEDDLKKSEHGFLHLGLDTDYTPIDKNIKVADKDTIKFIDDKILRHFGMNTAILSSDFTPEQYESFYQSSLEHIVIGLGQAFTRALFSRKAQIGFGNEIIFIPQYLEFMTMSQKIAAVRILGDRGDVYENEVRRIFGLRPDPELNGIRMMSLNYINVKNAEEYQLKKLGTSKEE